MKRRSVNARRPVAFDPSIPPQIDGLTEFQQIGRGGFSTVWRAKQSAMGRDVAVKVIDAALTDPQALARFQAEAARAGKLGEHPSIATVHAWGQTDGRPYLIMKLYARGSLRDRLRDAGVLPVDDVLAYGVQIAGALKFAHDQQIVHRDVKPENILQDNLTGQAVLTDFGIAADHSPGAAGDPRAMTVPYASPEMLRGEGVWPGSDVWSLAATLYTLLAGRPPFTDFAGREDRTLISERALTGPLPLLGPEVPAELYAVLRQALIGALGSERIAWASTFVERLTEVQRALGLEPTAVAKTPSPVPTPTPTPPVAAPAPTAVVTPPTENATGQWQAAAAAPRPAAVVPPAYTAPTANTDAGFAAPGYQPFTSRTAADNVSPAPAVTGLVGSTFNFAPPQAPAPTPKRTGPPWKIIAIGAACGLALAAGVYFVTGGSHGNPAQNVAQTSPTGASQSTAAPPATASTTQNSNSSSAPKPPSGVTVVPVSNGSAVKISWTDTAPVGQYQVVVALGSGYPTRVIPDATPQVISGLLPTRPYCFAVGYVYSLDGDVSYSPAVCIRGGVVS